MAWAAQVAASLLGPLGNRWRRTVAVARHLDQLAHLAGLDPAERELLVAAGYLHDLGYAHPIAATGCHPLDGARALAPIVPARLVALVAHHGSADPEAARRGLTADLAAYPHERTLLADLLTYADMTRAPDGRPVTIDDRVAKVCERYGPEHTVSRALLDYQPELARITDRLRHQLGTLAIPGDVEPTGHFRPAEPFRARADRSPGVRPSTHAERHGLGSDGAVDVGGEASR